MNNAQPSSLYRHIIVPILLAVVLIAVAAYAWRTYEKQQTIQAELDTQKIAADYYFRQLTRDRFASSETEQAYTIQNRDFLNRVALLPNRDNSYGPPSFCESDPTILNKEPANETLLYETDIDSLGLAELYFSYPYNSDWGTGQYAVQPYDVDSHIGLLFGPVMERQNGLFGGCYSWERQFGLQTAKPQTAEQLISNLEIQAANGLLTLIEQVKTQTIGQYSVVSYIENTGAVSDADDTPSRYDIRLHMVVISPLIHDEGLNYDFTMLPSTQPDFPEVGNEIENTFTKADRNALTNIISSVEISR